MFVLGNESEERREHVDTSRGGRGPGSQPKLEDGNSVCLSTEIPL